MQHICFIFYLLSLFSQRTTATCCTDGHYVLDLDEGLSTEEILSVNSEQNAYQVSWVQNGADACSLLGVAFWMRVEGNVNNLVASVCIRVLDDWDKCFLQALLCTDKPFLCFVRVENSLRELVAVLVSVTHCITSNTTRLYFFQALQVEITTVCVE